MAGLKKKRKEQSGSPNIVLVIFLVFFILVNITFGILWYYALQDRATAKSSAAAAEATKREAEKARDYYRMLYYEMKVVTGNPLSKEEDEKYNPVKESFMKDDYGDYASQTDKDETRKLVGNLRGLLGSAPDLRDRLDKAEKRAADAEANVTKIAMQIKRMEDFSKDHIKRQDTFYQDVTGRIDKENKDILNQVRINTDSFKKLTELTKELNTELDEKKAEVLKIKDDHETELKRLVREINILKAERKEMANAGAGGPAGAGRAGGDVFPLILDLSPGKPLWDTPVGRVVRVDLDLRQVVINVGAAHGVTPELTFNIFGANVAGRAEKQMKGSIEVIKVIDANTSLCRITSLYDSEGLSIPLNVQTRGRLMRESDAALREGDLLFNLFWGTRVAIAGYVNITGDASDNPAEQFRQMEDFMYLLKRNGMTVDAYVDLRDGKIQGQISPKTRYLIRGDDLRAPGEKPAPAPKKVDDDKEKDKEREPMPKEVQQPNLDRNDAVNRSSIMLRKDAIERGLLLISAENFATVIGYRKARSANTADESKFRPTLPYISTGQAGVLVAPERPKEEEKKADPEKKDN